MSHKSQPTALHKDIKRIYLLALVTSLVAGALIAIVIFLFGQFGEIELKLLFTTLAIGGFSLSGLASSVLSGKKQYAYFVAFCIVVSIFGLLVAIGVVWDFLDDDVWGRTLLAMVVLSFSLAHSSLMLLVESKKAVVMLARNATIGIIAVVAAMLLYFIVVSGEDIGELFFRILGVFAVLDVLGTIVTPLLKRL